MKTSFMLATLLVAGLAFASATHFDDFVARYGKSYHSVAEREQRRAIFNQNFKMIQRWNAEAALLGKDQVYNITEYSDFSQEEFSNMYLNFKEPEVKEPVTNFPVSENMPSSIDWRDRNCITAVKNQGQCGSCWAFSATETVESYWALDGRGLDELSPQQVTSCTPSPAEGCNGGFTTVAFDYLKTAGLESASAYPYESGNGNTGSCEYDAADVVAKISGWSYAAQNGDEKALQSAVATKGPISICVDASTWQFYTGGILSTNCGQTLDHCVQLVGYNTEGETPYWIVRNSWTAQWGINGYIYVEAFADDLCGIANCATYVEI